MPPTEAISVRTANPGQVLGRGVFVAPWMGPAGELVLLAITAQKRLAAPPLTIAPGSDSVRASDKLWDALEAADPDPRLRLKAI